MGICVGCTMYKEQYPRPHARGWAPFGQHQESQPLRRSNTESLRMLSKSETITLHMFKKLELPEVAIHGADQKECCLWRR